MHRERETSEGEILRNSLTHSWRFMEERQFSLREDPIFLLLRSSTGWVRPTHIMESNLLYLKSTDLNVNLVPKISSQKYPE